MNLRIRKDDKIMDKKLESLLKKIGLESKFYSYFEEGKVTKTDVSDDKSVWNIYLSLKNNIPLDVYNSIISLSMKNFDNLKDISLHLDVLESNDAYLFDYVPEAMNILANKYEKLASVTYDKSFKYEKLYLTATSNEDYKVLLDISDDLQSLLKMYGLIYEVKVSLKDENLIMGIRTKEKVITLREIITDMPSASVEGFIFGVDSFESTKTPFKILTLKLHDKTDSLYIKIFSRDSEEFKEFGKKLTIGTWIKASGNVKNDEYSRDLVLFAKNIEIIPSKDEIITDDEEEKRVELHAHTHMSQMDSVAGVEDLIKQAELFGHKAVAITDTNCLQAYPEAYHSKAKDLKIIYGAVVTVVDDNIDIVMNNEDNSSLLEDTYVVFDFETTGFNAGGKDQIIEVGAVKLSKGKIIDRFSELIDPKAKLNPTITNITGITDAMLKGKRSEEEVLREFKNWISDLPIVAHNAKFDVSFLKSAYRKYNLGVLNNVVIDTLELSRAMEKNENRHSLSALVKRYNIPFDEDNHHRADYDAEATALLLYKMFKILDDRGIEKISDIKKLVPKDEIHQIGSSYQVTILVKNNIGLKNLFKIISYANTKYFYKSPRILRSELENLREGILIGSSTEEGEVFKEASIKGDEELANIMNFYDYIEIAPLDTYNHLIQLEKFSNTAMIKEHIDKIISVAASAGKMIVATANVHHIKKEDKIYRQVIINQKVPGGGRHYLDRKEITNIPTTHFRTTKEMLDDFEFLGSAKAKEIVITNPNIIADMTEKVTVIKNNDKPFSPEFENSKETVTKIVYDKAKELYGEVLPKLIEERITNELTGIINGGFDVIYLIAMKLVKKSNDEGYLVGSRGSVGSSFIATLMGITEVNPLPAHYVCPKCKMTLFEVDGVNLGSKYPSGYDLPDKTCKCKTKFKKEGQDIPFATFLGFNADKVPDIDLNFSGDYQAIAHDYTKELFGEDNVFRAGTIGTVADKTAFGFVKGFMENKGVVYRQAEIERLALGCVGVKRTTGQHPGGIVVVPSYMDVFDFTPYQYPADDINKAWYTTHFDYHPLEKDLLKLDMLGHDDPTVLRYLSDLTGINILDIPFDDKEVLKLYSGPEVMGLTKEQIMWDSGTLGLPEFGTGFVTAMLNDTKPSTFADVVKISGLSHGTDVWTGNAKDVINSKEATFREIIGCRDDVMLYLSYKGIEPGRAFKISEKVRKKGVFLDEDDIKLMKEKDVPDWYISSCDKIKYLFPKAHATAYVMMCVRCAWFKIYYPIEYYASLFSIRHFEFDIETMTSGYEAIKNKIIEINNKGYEATNKEGALHEVLQSALEMVARGFKFGKPDLYRSDSRYFIIDEDKKTLIPPFRAIEGLGEVVSYNIKEEREKKKFISIEDLQNRAKISSSLIDKMRVLGMFEGMNESNQLTLF